MRVLPNRYFSMHAGQWHVVPSCRAQHMSTVETLGQLRTQVLCQQLGNGLMNNELLHLHVQLYRWPRGANLIYDLAATVMNDSLLLWLWS